jgi:hypothetical protein
VRRRGMVGLVKFRDGLRARIRPVTLVTSASLSNSPVVGPYVWSGCCQQEWRCGACFVQRFCPRSAPS